MLLQKVLSDINVSGNFSVDSKGKWRIIEGGAKFSIAHSGNIVAVAVGDAEFLGIDVEKKYEKVLKLEEEKKLQEEMNNENSSLDEKTETNNLNTDELDEILDSSENIDFQELNQDKEG